MEAIVLSVEGEVQTPRTFGFADLAALPNQVPDVGVLIPGREGSAVKLSTLLDATGMQAGATHVTLHAGDDDYAASVPLNAVIDRALIVYRIGETPLTESQGGPMRFLITDADACGVSNVDACANVKCLRTVQLTQGPGADSRPTAAS